MFVRTAFISLVVAGCAFAAMVPAMALGAGVDKESAAIEGRALGPWLQVSGRWSVRSGVIDTRLARSAAPPRRQSVLLRRDVAVANGYDVHARVAPAPTPRIDDAAIVFDYSDARTYAYVSIAERPSAGTAGVFVVRRGLARRIAHVRGRYAAGRTHRLTVQRRAQSVRVLVAGRVVGGARLTQPSRARYGVASTSGAATFAAVRLQRIATQSPAPTDPTNPADPNPDGTPPTTGDPTGPAPTPIPDPGMLRRPGPTNTGPTSASLTPSGSLTITTPGTVIEGVEITGRIQVRANDVTIRNFRINGNGAYYGIQATYGATGIVVEDGEISDIASAGIYGSGLTIRRVNIHDSDGDAMKLGRDSLVEQGWWHHLGRGEGAHADGNQSRGGGNLVFRNNFCDMGVTRPAPYKSNACFMLQSPDPANPLTNVRIENNWLEGGNYTIYCVAGTIVRNNRFGRDYRYGTLAGCGTSTVEGNVWDDTGAPL